MYDYDLTATSELERVFGNSFSTGYIIGIIIVCLLALALVALILVSNCFIFKKAGEKPWKGLIPLYNSFFSVFLPLKFCLY